MSREGRIETAQRWYDGESGPEAPISTAAPRNARCGTCGFYLPLAGSMRQMFGVCGNLYAPDDGRAVSADHGCGAHSEALLGNAEAPVEELPTVYDDSEVESVAVSRAPRLGRVRRAGRGLRPLPRPAGSVHLELAGGTAPGAGAGWRRAAAW